MILQVDNGEVCNGAGWEVEDVNVSNFSSFVLLPSDLMLLLLCLPAHMPAPAHSYGCCCISRPGQPHTPVSMFPPFTLLLCPSLSRVQRSNAGSNRIPQHVRYLLAHAPALLHCLCLPRCHTFSVRTPDQTESPNSTSQLMRPHSHSLILPF
jgi:hypothetical protein